MVCLGPSAHRNQLIQFPGMVQKTGAGTFAGTDRRVLRTKVPAPFLNHANFLKYNCGNWEIYPVRVSLDENADAGNRAVVLTRGMATFIRTVMAILIFVADAAISSRFRFSG